MDICKLIARTAAKPECWSALNALCVMPSLVSEPLQAGSMRA